MLRYLNGVLMVNTPIPFASTSSMVMKLPAAVNVSRSFPSLVAIISNVPEIGIGGDELVNAASLMLFMFKADGKLNLSGSPVSCPSRFSTLLVVSFILQKVFKFVHYISA